MGAPPSRSVKHHCFRVFCQDVALERRKKGMETGLEETDDRLTRDAVKVIVTSMLFSFTFQVTRRA